MPAKGQEPPMARMDPLQEGYLEAVLQIFPQHLSIVPDYIEILEKFGSKWDRPLLTTLIRLYEEAIAKTPIMRICITNWERFMIKWMIGIRRLSPFPRPWKSIPIFLNPASISIIFL